MLWSRTPVTTGVATRLGAAPPVSDLDWPMTRLTWTRASAVAAALGGRLPTDAEWEWMAGGGVRRYPWGDVDPTARHANLRDLGPGRSTPVGAYPAGATPDGLLDVAGNVWEWTATTVPGGGALVRGGSYQSIRLYARCGFGNDIPQSLSSRGIGLRVVRPA
ncbi:formylglycine-generating enzyme family protein [Plantactinospora sp. CA-290183]|uniref:formylglycine-generating enzyme family protein n=1 Tax=Plantactinospora sp. CA-290183 TaxID=3240006 RepID=UPI003D9336CE